MKRLFLHNYFFTVSRKHCNYLAIITSNHNSFVCVSIYAHFNPLYDKSGLWLFPHNTSILKWRFEIQKYSGVTSFSIIPPFNIWLSKERVGHCREMMSCFRSTALHAILAEWIHNKWGTDLLWRFKCSLCFAYKIKRLSKLRDIQLCFKMSMFMCRYCCCRKSESDIN